MRLFLYTFMLSFFLVGNELTLEHYAQQWSYNALSPCFLQHAQFLLNLLYWSYQRSISTLHAQKAFLASQQLNSQAIYSITSRRLNPAREQIYHLKTDDIQKAHEKFINYFEEHQRIGDIYTHCVELLYKKDLPEHLMKSTEDIRQHARKVITQALYQQVYEIDEHFKALKNTIKDSYELFEKLQSTRTITTELFNYVWHFLPALMVKSFVQADQQLTDINHQLWDALLKSEAFGNLRWHIIEEKRAEFYATYYNAFYRCMQSAAMPSEAYLNLFDTPTVLPTSLQATCVA
jgi:hypothetical protein